MELKIQNRFIFGKKTKKLRADGLVPAEIFGHGFKNEHVSIPAKDFSKAFKEAGENTVINLVNEKGEKIPVIVSDVDFNNMKGVVLSVDFHRIRMDEKIQTKVPVELVGEAPAVKKGLMVMKILNEIDVEALPNQIPHRYEIDITHLENPGQGVYVKDLKATPNVKILSHAESAIVTIAETAKEESEATVAPAPAEGGIETETPAAEEKTEEKK
ncbi:MAG: 50S ribosomal protein L25 [Minisyncoccia bacterium]